MLLEYIISIGSIAVLLPWLLLIFFPFWRGTQIFVHSALVPFSVGALYAVVYVTYIFTTDQPLSGNTLEGQMAIFTAPEVIVAAWLHFVVFDLFVGAWQVRDAKRIGLNHLWVVPCLLLTLFGGPLGLLVYLLIRFLGGKKDGMFDEQVTSNGQGHFSS